MRMLIPFNTTMCSNKYLVTLLLSSFIKMKIFLKDIAGSYEIYVKMKINFLVLSHFL